MAGCEMRHKLALSDRVDSKLRAGDERLKMWPAWNDRRSRHSPREVNRTSRLFGIRRTVDDSLAVAEQVGSLKYLREADSLCRSFRAESYKKKRLAKRRLTS